MWPQSRYRGRQRVYLQAMRSPISLHESRSVQPKEILITSAKRLLQQKSAHTGEVPRCVKLVVIGEYRTYTGQIKTVVPWHEMRQSPTRSTEDLKGHER